MINEIVLKDEWIWIDFKWKKKHKSWFQINFNDDVLLIPSTYLR
jgi:hypothetical protein